MTAITPNLHGLGTELVNFYLLEEHSAVSVLVHCGGSLASKCRLTATMTVFETTKTGIVVGTAKITLAGGQRKPLRVKLNATGRRLLAANHKLRIRLKIAQTRTTGATALSTQTLLFWV